MIQIIKTITQPEEVINAFADSKGYQEQIANPDYVSTTNFDGEEDVVTGEGEPTMDNPMTRTEYVSALFDKFALDLFAANADVQIDKELAVIAKAQKAQARQAIAATIATEIK